MTRLPAMRLRVISGAALVSLTTASCTSGTPPQSTSPVLGIGFSQQVIAVCQHALAEKNAEPPFPFSNFNPTSPDASKLPAIGRYEQRGVQIFQSWLHQMQALGTPRTGGPAWAALLSALRAHTQIIADQQAAAQRGDAEAFTRDYFAGNHAQDQMVRAADQAGVPICATAAGA